MGLQDRDYVKVRVKPNQLHRPDKDSSLRFSELRYLAPVVVVFLFLFFLLYRSNDGWQAAWLRYTGHSLPSQDCDRAAILRQPGTDKPLYVPAVCSPKRSFSI